MSGLRNSLKRVLLWRLGGCDFLREGQKWVHCRQKDVAEILPIKQSAGKFEGCREKTFLVAAFSSLTKAKLQSSSLKLMLKKLQSGPWLQLDYSLYSTKRYNWHNLNPNSSFNYTLFVRVWILHPTKGDNFLYCYATGTSCRKPEFESPRWTVTNPNGRRVPHCTWWPTIPATVSSPPSDVNFFVYLHYR